MVHELFRLFQVEDAGMRSSRTIRVVGVILVSVFLLVVLGVITTEISDAGFRNWLDGSTKNEPLVTAVIAAAALFVSIRSFIDERRRGRGITLDAYAKWSAERVEDRLRLTALLGEARISTAQARSLLSGNSPIIDAAAPLTEEETAEARAALLRLLNGLERIATGLRLGVYDEEALSRLAGGIIVRTWRRFEPYVIERRRTDIGPDFRRERAFVEFEWMAARLAARKERL